MQTQHSIVRSRIAHSLERLGLRLGPEIAARMEELDKRISGLDQRLAEAERRATARWSSIPISNDGSGELTISRYRKVLERLAADVPGAPIDAVELVQSDVGPILFPTFDRFILPSIRSTGGWEAEECQFLRSKLGPGMTVLDVGANVGYTALVMAREVGPEGLVIALEPEPLNFELLCSNLRINGVTNILPIQSAAGESTGSIVLERSPDNAGDHRTAHHPLGLAPVTVPLIALDDLLPKGVKIDFVVSDAQGYDHRVVRGLTGVIDQFRPPFMIEFWPVGIMSVGDDPDEVLAFYRSKGYRTHILPDVDITPLSAEGILLASTEGKDHVTLLLVPQTT